MRAHKFLAKGGLGPISSFAWPVPLDGGPGAWVEVEGALAQCTRGVHACRITDLAHWIHDELWEIETAGDQMPGVDCVVVQRARLVRRVHAWDDAGAQRFADACIEHATIGVAAHGDAAARDLLDDARVIAAHGYVATTAYTTALAVSRVAAEAADDAYRLERTWQSAWIARELIGVRL